ncbi:MAG TPA: hypothetical protein VHK69_06590, partial [Chitinophagaceae bacterium]|nr:hypothetical protein [Chitinophagaceae bacterium]
NTGTGGGGTATIRLSGTGAQTVQSSVTAGQGRLPHLLIDKASGTLQLSGVITVIGHWTLQSGTVAPGTSTVYFQQGGNIDATGSNGTMAFYNLTLGDNQTRTLTGNAQVNNILALGSGRLLLNSNTCHLASGAAGAITRSTGYIVSEAVSNNSRVSWAIGANGGNHVFPFGTAPGSAYIPFGVEITAGDAGTVTVSTYPTAVNNTPYPVTPDAVTTLAWGGQSDFSASIIDRFWQIGRSGATCTATLTYTYAPAEVTATVAGSQSLLLAHRYDKASNQWQYPRIGQTSIPASYTVIEPGVTVFSARMLAVHSSPLAVRFLDFRAQREESGVRVQWRAEGETGGDRYSVERSADGRQFISLQEIAGTGSEGTIMTYTFTDTRPLPAGYYRLKNTDNRGAVNYSRTVLVKSSQVRELVLMTLSAGQYEVQISGLRPPQWIRIFDAAGRQVRQAQTDGSGRYAFTIEGWSPGVYTVTAGGQSVRFILP